MMLGIEKTLLEPFTKQSKLLTTLKKKKTFRKHCGEKEKMLETSTVFSTNPNKNSCFCFKLHLFCRLQMPSIWTSVKSRHLAKS